MSAHSHLVIRRTDYQPSSLPAQQPTSPPAHHPSLVVQWLGFGALTAAARVRFPVRESSFAFQLWTANSSSADSCEKASSKPKHGWEHEKNTSFEPELNQRPKDGQHSNLQSSALPAELSKGLRASQNLDISGFCSSTAGQKVKKKTRNPNRQTIWDLDTLNWPWASGALSIHVVSVGEGPCSGLLLQFCDCNNVIIIWQNKNYAKGRFSELYSVVCIQGICFFTQPGGSVYLGRFL